MGALTPGPEGHGGWKLAPLAWEILKGRKGLSMRLPEEPEPGSSRRERHPRPSRKSWVDEFLDTEDKRSLWRRLRGWRAQTASEAGVPPYIIFHDKTLLDVVQRQPHDLAGLAEAEGMGRAKLDRYGLTLLTILAEHRVAMATKAAEG